MLQRLNLAIGRTVAWLTLVMVLVTFAIVVLRYCFDLGWIWLQESVTWMHAAVFMLGAAYTLAQDEHVRVDVFYRTARPKRRALVDLLGTLLFLAPVTLFLCWSSWGYVLASWQVHEGSPDAGGLLYPFISLAKTLIPVTATLLLLQAVAMVVVNARVLLGSHDQ